MNDHKIYRFVGGSKHNQHIPTEGQLSIEFPVREPADLRRLVASRDCCEIVPWRVERYELRRLRMNDTVFEEYHCR